MLVRMDNTALQIRPAIADDVAAIARLIEPFVAQRQLLPRSEEELAALIPSAFVATDEDRVVGCAAVEVYSRKLAEILCLAVHSDYQGRGLGCRLVERCVDYARDHGVLELMSITASDSLFRRAGFDYILPDQKRAMFTTLR